VPSPTVKIATADDSPLLHRLAAATFALACPPGTTLEAIDDFIAVHLSEQRFTHYLADPVRDLLLVEADGEALGYSMLVSGDPTDDDVLAVVHARPVTELSKFYLLQSAHGSGAAATLMTASVERARERGAASVWLGVNQHNARANRFYEKSGFVTVGTKRFLVGGKWEDDFVRALELNVSSR
jgi:ribosomal protein S18 acetylase RimI-like enzyme